ARGGTGSLPGSHELHGRRAVFLYGRRDLRIRRRAHLQRGTCRLQVRARACYRTAGRHGGGARRHGGELLMTRHSAQASLTRRARVRRPRGWTLIEVVVVLAVVGIIAAIGSRLMAGMFDSYFAARDITN